jgi:L,D-transpeptidase YnhG
MFRLFIVLLFIKSLVFCEEVQTYSISVCTSTTLKNAINCKKNIEKTHSFDVFIVKGTEQKYVTFLGSFFEYSQAKSLLDESSDFIKKQKPFIKKLPYNLKSMNSKKLQFIDLSSKSEKTSLPNLNLDIFEDKKYLEEIKTFSSEIIDKYTPSIKITPIKKVDNLLSDFAYFDNLIIEVDSSKNSLVLKGKSKRGLKYLKTYKVSTAKKSIKKPLGEGNVTSISLNPIWYPTPDTIESFKKRGIDLPTVVPGGHKLNYMGSAKINLTHRVDGKDTFRIHGTIDEKTIGSYESSGCIRMKNNEVVELVSLLNEFIEFKSMQDIKVILK